MIPNFLIESIDSLREPDFFVNLREHFERLSTISHLESARVFRYVKMPSIIFTVMRLFFTPNIDGYHDNDIDVTTFRDTNK